jgi:transposase-like protein
MAAGRPTDYDPDFHPQEIIKLMKEQGYTAVQVVRDWNICTDTLSEWCVQHPEFSAAYTRAKNYRTAWWMDKAQQGIFTGDGEHFDSRLFGLMMKYNGVNMDERIIKLPQLVDCKSFSEQATCIMGALAVGKITLGEANGYVDIIGKMAKIDEVTDLRRMLEEIELARKQGR